MFKSKLAIFGVMASMALAHPATANEKLNFQQSLEAWTEAKSANNKSYEFTHSFQSWVGFSNKTVVTVRNGKVVSRKYYEKGRDEAVASLVYEETGKAISTDQRGYPAISMDTVYAKCRTDVFETNQTNRAVYFSTNEMGILSTCGYRDTRCADDCFIGTRISAFRWLDH